MNTKRLKTIALYKKTCDHYLLLIRDVEAEAVEAVLFL